MSEAAIIERLLAHARCHPLYESTRSDFASLNDVPVLTKERLTEVVQPLESHPRFAHGTYWTRSGGSSGGAPAYVPVCLEENLESRRILAAHLRAAGVLTPETVALNLYWAGHLYRPCELFTDLCTFAGVTSLPLTPFASTELLLDTVRRFRPTMLLADPTDAVRACRALEALGERVEIPDLLYACSPLYPAAEACLREQMGLRRICSVLGSAETGVWGYRTPDDAPGCFRVAPELAHIEILDADETGVGRLVVTSLMRFRHPILRYDTGDRARLVAPASGEGPAVIEFFGRSPRDFNLSGHLFSLANFTALQARALGMQIVLDHDRRSNLESLCVRLALRDGDDPAAVRRLYEETIDALPVIEEERMLGIRFIERSLEFTALEALERQSGSGKLMPIVDRRTQEPGH